MGFFDGTMPAKLTRPLSAPGSPRDRSGMMTPGDFASLQEGREGLSTEDYIAWKLPEEEDPDEYPFPLTLRNKKDSSTNSPAGLDGTLDNSITIMGGPSNASTAQIPSQLHDALARQSNASTGDSNDLSGGLGAGGDAPVGAVNGARSHALS